MFYFFCFDNFVKKLKKDHNYEFTEPNRTVMVGDRLATDMVFGNLNNMHTVYVH